MRTRGQVLGIVATLGTAWLCVSCATAPVVLTPVGPAPGAGTGEAGAGQLVVYSDTDERHLDQSSTFYVHSSYVIQTSDGRQIRWVQNHLSVMDERPQRVSLPPGTYQVVARSEDYGRVRVPVVIRSGGVTEVHLVDTWKPREKVADVTRLVRFPNGYIVGWSAAVSSR